MYTSTPKKVLIAPLDWGLGHTSRCIAIALHYQQEGHSIFFAGHKLQQQIFSASCSFATLLHLEGYGVNYPKAGWAFMPKMVAQLPKIQQSIHREHQWLDEQMKKHDFDIVISDNRYGLHHPKTRSILLTHQLHIQTGTQLGNIVIRKKLQQLLGKFTEVWVADTESSENLAGILSHKIVLKQPIHYIGWLSQFQQLQQTTAHPLGGHKYTLAILSGPEPMRTQLEVLLLAQMSALKETNFVMIAGVTKGAHAIPKNVKYIPLGTSEIIYQYMQHCDYIISRSGYSTVMDVLYLQKPAVFLPTPGQTEQEYLANTYRNRKWFNSCKQQVFDIQTMQPWQNPQLQYKSLLPKL